MPQENGPNALNLVVVNSSRPLRGTAQRQPAAAVVAPSGRTRLNAAAMDMIDDLAVAAGLKVDAYALELSVDTVAGVVGIMPVKPETMGSQAWRVNGERRRGTFYVSEILKGHQELRFSETRACPARLYPNEQNPKWLILTLKTSLTKRKGPARSDGSTSPEAKPPQQEIDAP